MNLKYLYIFVLAVLFACEDFEDPNLDFSNSLPQYVELSSGDTIKTIEGSTVDITVRMREVRPNDVTVNYEVSGDFTTSGSIVIPKTKLNASASISVPNNSEVDNAGNAILTLTSVDNGLSIGRGGPEAGFSNISRVISWEEDSKVIALASADTTEINEAIYNVDTLFYVVSSGNPVDGNVSLNYDITGDLTNGDDYTLLSANPLILEEGTSSDTIAIKLNGVDNDIKDDTRSIYVRLTSISGGNAETSLSGEAISQGFDIIDDIRTIAIVGDTSKVSGNTIVDIPVELSDLGFDHSSSLEVNYSISGGTPIVDYEDVTGGTLTFIDDSSETIRVEVKDSGSFTLTVTIDSVDDPETEIDEDADSYIIETEN